MAIGWMDFITRWKPPLSQKGLSQAMAQCVQAAVHADAAAPLRAALNQSSLGTDWFVDLGKTLEKAARELAAQSTRAGQARLCRVQLLDRIMTNVSYEAVLELDPELRQRWLAFNTKETPFDLQKQMDILTLRIAFGKLVLDALQAFYAAQYNGVLNSALFLTPYRLVCAAFMEFKVRTFHILAGESVFRHRGAAVYDEIDVAASGTRLSQAKKQLAAAIEAGDKSKILAAQTIAAQAIRECMTALDQFKLAGSRSGALFRHSVPL